jgi:hypothetical protein
VPGDRHLWLWHSSSGTCGVALPHHQGPQPAGALPGVRGDLHHGCLRLSIYVQSASARGESLWVAMGVVLGRCCGPPRTLVVVAQEAAVVPAVSLHSLVYY